MAKKGRYLTKVVDFENPKEVEKAKKIVNRRVKVILKDKPKYEEIASKRSEDIWDIFKLIPQIKKSMKSTSKKIVKSWIRSSIIELDRASLLFENKDYGGSIHHLQMAIEKGIKSYGLQMGILGEDDMKKISHNPMRFFVTLLEQPWIQSAVRSFGVNKDIQTELGKLRNLSTINEKNLKMILDLDKDIPAFLNLRNVVKKAVEEGLSDDETRSILEQIEIGSNMKSVYIMWTEFAVFYMFIGLFTSVFHQATSYPDEFRKLGIKYSDLNLIKNFKPIIELMKNNLTCLEKNV